MPEARTDGLCIWFQQQVSAGHALHVVHHAESGGAWLCPFRTYDLLREAAPAQEICWLDKESKCQDKSCKQSACSGVSGGSNHWTAENPRRLLEGMMSLRYESNIQGPKAILRSLPGESHPMSPMAMANGLGSTWDECFLPTLYKSLCPDKND